MKQYIAVIDCADLEYDQINGKYTSTDGKYNFDQIFGQADLIILKNYISSTGNLRLTITSTAIYQDAATLSWYAMFNDVPSGRILIENASSNVIIEGSPD